MQGYDYFIALLDEIQHIWPRPFGISSILFLLTRYSPFLDAAVLFARLSKPLMEVEMGYNLTTGLKIAVSIDSSETIYRRFYIAQAGEHLVNG